MAHAGIDGSRQDATSSQMIDLVFHQCDEWSDNYTDSLTTECWYLKCDRLTSTRRHKAKRVMTFSNGLNDVSLDSAEIIISPITFENLLVFVHLMVFSVCQSASFLITYRQYAFFI